MRVSPVNTTNDVSETDPEGLFTVLADALKEKPLAYLHVIEAAAEPRVTRAMRKIFRGSLVVNDGYDRNTAEKALKSDLADLVSFGRHFIANPDLPARFEKDADLNETDPSAFYGGSEKGYIDYPRLG